MTGSDRGPAPTPGGRSSLNAPTTRRAFLATGLAAAIGGLAGCGGDGSTRHGWIDVESPSRKGLEAVVVTSDGPYAVGKSGHVVTRRGDEWRLVQEHGPAGDDNALYGAAVTDDGRTVWVAGDSGAVGRYDVGDDELEDFTAPREKTSSWADVAVTGKTDHERVLLVNSSGELLPGRWTNAGVRWGEIAKPTGGESATAVDVAGMTAFVTDTGGGVYRRKLSGDGEWTAAGVRGVDVVLHDIAAVDGSQLTVAADDGSLYVYNGYNWLQLRAGERTLHAVDREAHRGVAVGNDGTVHVLGDNEWSSESTPTRKTLKGCALGTASYADVAVGTDGAILERFG